MKKALFAATAAVALVIGGHATAQDYSLSPTFGATNLSANFQPDPYRISLTAGGPIDVSRQINGCFGFIADAPDYRLQYTPGGFSLFFYVDAPEDTTLVINAPDGSWYCDDDTRGLDPVVQFPSPMAGQYDIWVGTWGNTYPSATLNISEIGYNY